jgi:hypothetical protein
MSVKAHTLKPRSDVAVRSRVGMIFTMGSSLLWAAIYESAFSRVDRHDISRSANHQFDPTHRIDRFQRRPSGSFVFHLQPFCGFCNSYSVSIWLSLHPHFFDHPPTQNVKSPNCSGDGWFMSSHIPIDGVLTKRVSSSSSSQYTLWTICRKFICRWDSQCSRLPRRGLSTP